MYLFYFSYGKYTKLPNCKHCKHYKISLTNEYFSKCSKFFHKIKNQTVVIYEYADLMRLDEDKCGKEGKFYENKEYRDYMLKVMEHNLINIMKRVSTDEVSLSDKEKIFTYKNVF
jgi:hypothetical protein